MTVMVANVAVNLEAFDESVATCRFAQRCSRLVNNVSIGRKKYYP